MFVILPFEIIGDLILIVLFLGIYNFYKAHKLVINEKILELNNLSRDINIVHYLMFILDLYTIKRLSIIGQ